MRKICIHLFCARKMHPVLCAAACRSSPAPCSTATTLCSSCSTAALLWSPCSAASTLGLRPLLLRVPCNVTPLAGLAPHAPCGQLAGEEKSSSLK